MVCPLAGDGDDRAFAGFDSLRYCSCFFVHGVRGALRTGWEKIGGDESNRTVLSFPRGMRLSMNL